jgi:hypothetical protein
MKKVGAFLGDFAEIGCNSVLNPGTVIGRNAQVYPLSCVRGTVPANHIYKDKDLAEKIGTDPGYLSHGFKKGFSDQMKKRMHKVLRFDAEEREALGEWDS